MKANRKDLLSRLLCVEPGISKQESLQQSSCVILKRGRFLTMSNEIACSVPSGLPVQVEGALRAEKLIKLLEKMPDEEVDIATEEGSLFIKGDKRDATFALESQIVLPVDEVEKPNNWSLLHEEFSTAVDLVQRCTLKKDDFAKECVHIHPQWIEACDNARMVRWPLNTFVKKSVLVRGTTIKVMADLGMTHGCETDNWLHFGNTMNLRISLRKFAIDEFLPLDEFLKIRGKRILLPNGLKDMAERAGVLSEGKVSISLSDRGLLVTGESVEGKYSERSKIPWKGEAITFSVPHKMIRDLIEKNNECEVTECSLRVDGGKYIYVTGLER